jgi:hypothetical protein
MKAFLGIVSGRSTELSKPGCAATTYGMAFTTAVDSSTADVLSDAFTELMSTKEI